MTDITPVQQPASPEAAQFLSVQEVLEVERLLRENKAAEQRGDPLPNNVAPERIAAALATIRRQRGTLDFASKSSAGKKGVSKVQLDIEEL